ncbi:MAG: hypothetical protein COA47_17685 [Robiginitomaculum sp.]|nr:MAG: hypothetical protein COA47_17685 [Robiginitomaculum sp.]
MPVTHLATGMRLTGLFTELRRRNIFRVAGVYAVVGWILMQAAGVLENSLHLPDWFDSAITAALLIGFPVAMLLAWAFEMTPEGMKRTEVVAEGESVTDKTGRTLDYVIVGGLVLVAALVIWQGTRGPILRQAQDEGTEVVANTTPHSRIKSGTGSELVHGSERATNDAITNISAASIAVLPFADLSPDKDQGYFSDGMAEEILNVLANLSGLKVASRTSSFQFKGQEAIGIPIIAQQLHVRHILEGSVRKAGDTIRITAQLIDAETDKHMWSETFDRTLTTSNIFAVQDEITKAIVEQLSSRIAGPTKIAAPTVRNADTQNLDAYELYLQARALFRRRNNVNLPNIIETFEQVVAADPDFARGWAGLAAAYGVAPSWDVLDRDYFTLSNEAARRAITLNPDLSLPYAVLGNNKAGQVPGEFADAFVYYAEALKRDPKDVNALQWRGEAYVATGFFDEADAGLKRCIEIDPNYLQCRMWHAKTKLFQGKTDEGLALYEDALSRGGVGGELLYAITYAHAGDDRAARLVLASVFQRFSWLNGRTERLYRALTDPAFDFKQEAKAHEVEWKAIHGDYEAWSGATALIFKNYAAIKRETNNPFWWIRTDPDFLKSPDRKRVIRESGVYDYWRENGFPPQCKAVGADDFECE